MALTGKKYEPIHNKTGDDLVAIKSSFDNNKHQDLLIFEGEAALIYQMQKMQDALVSVFNINCKTLPSSAPSAANLLLPKC